MNRFGNAYVSSRSVAVSGCRFAASCLRGTAYNRGMIRRALIDRLLGSGYLVARRPS